MLYPVHVVVEGDTDLVVAGALLSHAGLTPDMKIVCAGKSKLDALLPGYNHAAKYSPWLVLRDLDQDAPCAAALVASLVSAPGAYLCLRVAVRAIEAWRMADAERLARFLHVRVSQIPHDPDVHDNPSVPSWMWPGARPGLPSARIWYRGKEPRDPSGPDMRPASSSSPRNRGGPRWRAPVARAWIAACARSMFWPRG